MLRASEILQTIVDRLGREGEDYVADLYATDAEDYRALVLTAKRLAQDVYNTLWDELTH